MLKFLPESDRFYIFKEVEYHVKEKKKTCLFMGGEWFPYQWLSVINNPEAFSSIAYVKGACKKAIRLNY